MMNLCIKPGNAIVYNTSTNKKCFVSAINDEMVIAIQAEGEILLKIFPAENLIDDNWWIEKQE